MLPTVKVQTWANDLRLPCLTQPAEYTGLLSSLEPLRRPALPFQSKHLPALKRDTWYVLQRTERTRPGLLVIWGAQKCCVYISGDRTPKIALLRLRIDPQFFDGLTVFAATLSSRTRRLLIEDTLMWKGRRTLDEEIFSKRWAMAVQWVEHYCLVDQVTGVGIEMARWTPLETLRPTDAWDLQPDDTGRSRYFWVAGAEPAPAPAPAPAQLQQQESGPLVAVAERDIGPEQWLLKAGDGTALGRALVRTLAVSDSLRSMPQKVRVEVEWNTVFSKWEIKGLTEADATRDAGNFNSSK